MLGEPTVLLYRFLDRLPLPGGYATKFILVGGLAVHVPLLAVLAWTLPGALTDASPKNDVLLLVLGATVFGTLLAGFSLHALLVPIRLAESALATYERGGVLPRLPLAHRDLGGRLMATTQATLVSLDSALIAAHGVGHDALTSLARRDAALAEVASDLRVPLDAVLTRAELLQMQENGPLGDPRYAELAADIEASGAYMMTLVERLRAFAATRDGRAALEAEPVELAPVLERVAGLLYRVAVTRSISLDADIPSGLAVRADPRALLQMLLDLVGNAVRHAGNGAQITVMAEVAAEAVRITVADDGVGMTEVERAAALEPFERGPQARWEAPGGLGLGLPLVVTLARLAGGQLDLDSRPGLGTVARLTLPGALLH